MKHLNYIQSAVAALGKALSASAASHLKTARYEVADQNKQRTTLYTNPYSNSDRSVLYIAPELDGLEGVRLPLTN